MLFGRRTWIPFGLALLAASSPHLGVVRADELSKAMGSGYVELTGAEAAAFVVGNTLSDDGIRGLRFQVSAHEAILYSARSNLCERMPAEVTRTLDCEPDGKAECRPSRVFAVRNRSPDNAALGAWLGDYVPAGPAVAHWEVKTDLMYRRKILKGDVVPCPTLQFDPAARPLSPAAADAAAIGPTADGEAARAPAGLDARLLIGNSVVRRPAEEMGCAPTVTYFAPDGRVIVATCSVEGKGAPTRVSAEVVRSWRALAAPLCSPGAPQYYCKDTEFALRGAARRPLLCLENAEDAGVFADCDTFRLSLKTSADGPVVEVGYSDFDGFPGVLYRGDVMGLAKFPRRSR